MKKFFLMLALAVGCLLAGSVFTSCDSVLYVDPYGVDVYTPYVSYDWGYYRYRPYYRLAPPPPPVRHHRPRR